MKNLLKNNNLLNENGNALITLLFFIVIAVTVISSTALVLSANMLSTHSVEQGTEAYYAAESGAENGMLDVLRNPLITITVAQHMSVGNGHADITISDNGTKKQITSTGTSGTSVRKIQVELKNESTGFKITSWKEIE